jgi:hypothetical protein
MDVIFNNYSIIAQTVPYAAFSRDIATTRDSNHMISNNNAIMLVTMIFGYNTIFKPLSHHRIWQKKRRSAQEPQFWVVSRSCKVF